MGINRLYNYYKYFKVSIKNIFRNNFEIGFVRKIGRRRGELSSTSRGTVSVKSSPTQFDQFANPGAAAAPSPLASSQRKRDIILPPIQNKIMSQFHITQVALRNLKIHTVSLYSNPLSPSLSRASLKKRFGILI